jgi:hypothetical protein
VYTTYLSQSEIFVGIYWQRYGWVGPDQKISGLEDEYLLSRGKPSLFYVKAPTPDREARLDELPEPALGGAQPVDHHQRERGSP